MWLTENESMKFWLSALTELKNRYPGCLFGWSERVPRCDTQRIPSDTYSPLYHLYDVKQHQICVVKGL